MGERKVSHQEYKLIRSYWIATSAILPITLFLLFLTVDIIFLDTGLFSWVNADNYLPLIWGLAVFSIPFWILGIASERKLKREFDY